MITFKAAAIIGLLAAATNAGLASATSAKANPRLIVETATRTLHATDCHPEFAFAFDPGTDLSGILAANCADVGATPHAYSEVPSTGLVVLGFGKEALIDCYLTAFSSLEDVDDGALTLQFACADDNLTSR
jgi:hypothetical protein